MLYVRVFLLCLFLTAIGTANADADIAISAPAGFEEDDIAAVETIVDIAFRDEIIGSSGAVVKDGEIHFLDPEGVASLIPGVRDQATIVDRLKSPLPTNIDLVCNGSKPSKTCGWIDADVIEAIFDPSLFQVELFINDLYTYYRDERSRYLPRPTIAPGLINSIDLRGFHDIDKDRQSGSARISTIAGHGRWSVRAENLLSDSNQSLQSMTVHRIGQKHEFEAGYLPYTHQSGLIRSTRTLGVRFGSTLKTRRDRNALYTSGLAVNVSAPAVVEIVHDGVVIDVQRVEPGVDKLDTRRLPNGSYDVTLRINESGQVREEIQTFSTGRGLPPKSHTVWSIEAGAPVERGAQVGWAPKISDDLFVDANIQRRIAPNAGVGGRLLYQDGQAFTETSLTVMKNGFDAKIGALVSSQGDAGLESRIGFSKGSFSTSLNYREVWRNGEMARNDEPDLLSGSFRQASLNSRWGWSRGRVGLHAYYRESEDRETWFITPSVDITLLKRKNFELTGTYRHQFGVNRDSDFVGLRLSARPQSKQTRWRQSLSANTSYRQTTGNGVTDSQSIADISWRASRKVSRDSNVAFSLGVRKENELGGKAGVRISTPAANGSLDVWSNYQSRNSLFLDAETTIITSRSGLAFSSTRDKAGVFVKANGLESIDVSAMIDGVAKTTFNSVHQRYVPLREFSIHDVGLKPSEAGDLKYNQQTERLVLFPGNVAVVNRNFSAVQIAIGRLSDETGTALMNVTLYGKDGRWLGTTDEHGYFQADLEVGEPISVVAGLNHKKCRTPLNSNDLVKANAAFVNLGNLSCSI